MIEPVEIQFFVLSFFSAAVVVFAGTLYALLFALGKRLDKPWLVGLSYGAYGLLAVAAATLARAANLTEAWQILILFMLLGYLVAPHVVWHLCVGTHLENGRG